jgi:4'-phosphopantetheinyl transferase EntD
MFRSEKKEYGDVEVHLMYYSDFDESEHLHNLLPKEKQRLQTFRHPSRRREYIATRVLRSTIFGNEPILYNEFGAPTIEEEGFISISHANNVVGLAYSRWFQIGMDLEPVREKAKLVRHKFLSEQEQQLLDQSCAIEMTKVWSGKEALYKLANRKQLIFARELLLEKSNDMIWNGTIVSPNLIKKVLLSIEQQDDFVISVNTEPVIDVAR